jgi:hypothetical protein
MNVWEIKCLIERLTPGEMAEVESFLKALRRARDPAFQKKVAEAHRRMDAGRYVTAAQLRVMLKAH